ncbi:uncharacterized protein BDV14DRAFT_171088, partial [Aspergillus stella-maris]|uniref:uncharacterized protein n=1 Tax=Aspergillus stella-maris TaxID=1810926 RepID=UPI003CCD693B
MGAPSEEQDPEDLAFPGMNCPGSGSLGLGRSRQRCDCRFFLVEGKVFPDLWYAAGRPYLGPAVAAINSMSCTLISVVVYCHRKKH